MPPLLVHRQLTKWSFATLVGTASVVMACATLARAELTWPEKTVELKADASTSVVEARFAFKNNDSKPIEVTQVMSSCGCTTVELEKRHYEPGEGGEIVARYTLGEHTGQQKKSVLVATNDGAEPTELNLSVKIPEVLRITPAFLTWKHDETPVPKQIVIEMAQNTDIKDISVQTSNASVTAELVPVVKGRKYQLTVNPGHTDQHLFATLTVHTRFGDAERTYRAYATVQPPVREEQPPP